MGINEILNELEDKGEELRQAYSNDIYVGDLVRVIQMDDNNEPISVFYGVVLLADEYGTTILTDDEMLYNCLPYDMIQRSGIRFDVMEHILLSLPRVKELF